MLRVRWKAGWVVVALVPVPIAVGCGALLSWSVGELRSEPVVCAAASPSDIHVVTFNALLLREPERVDPYVDAVFHTAAMLGPSAAPDLVATQEIESDAATEALRARFERDGLAATFCECAPGRRVGAAVSRARFEVTDTDCIGLGVLFPDHARCAVRVHLDDRVTGEALTFVAVHAAFHPTNESNADTLLEALVDDRGRTILAGDFNADEGWPLRDRLESGGFLDANRGDGASYATGWRLDAVMHGERFEATCRTRSDETFAWAHPAPSAHVECDADGCTLSDHLPIGATLRPR